MLLEVSPIIETLDVRIGESVIPLKLDLSVDGRKGMATTFIPAAQKIEFQERLFEDASARGDEKAAAEAKERIADLVEECFSATVGKKAYNRLIDALTSGCPNRRADCTARLTDVMHGISEVFRQANERDSNARSLGGAAQEAVEAMRDHQEGEEVAQPVAIKAVE